MKQPESLWCLIEHRIKIQSNILILFTW